jgi:hypothetical protein
LIASQSVCDAIIADADDAAHDADDDNAPDLVFVFRK